MNSDNNKRLLWKLLYDKQYFAKFNNSQFGEIKTLFDSLIIEVDKTSQGSVLDKNKQFILEFIKRLNSINIPYKREDIINNRKEELLDNFNKKTIEFNEFNLAPPNEINFADSIEDTPIDLLKHVSQINEERNKDEPILQQILKHLKKIDDNQEKILTILTRSEENKIVHKANTSEPEVDLINIDVNE
tara:strand:- start:6746 stop:7309 length:564 start_codon:yes stop_codon:yes gene_type:complete